jgi:hypothetical protein
MNFARPFFAVLAALWGGALLLLATPAAALSSSQSLATAAHELSQSPAATRAAFVEAAVAELAAAQRAAAHVTAKAGAANKHDVKAAAWNRGAQAYIGTLQAAAAAARAGAPVRLVVDRGRMVRVVVGQHPARQFIVAAPQPKGRPALERAILRRLCAQDGCGDAQLTAVKGEPPLTTVRITAPVPGAIADTAPPATPLTVYRAPPAPKPAPPPALRLVSALSASDGLACAQDEVRHHVLYDNACKALLGDVRALVTALHGAAKRGVAIDWTMPARPVAKGDKYELAINGRGDVVSLAMPALAEAPEMLVDILPWAHARLFGSFATLALRPPSRLVYGGAIAQR